MYGRTDRERLTVCRERVGETRYQSLVRDYVVHPRAFPNLRREDDRRRRILFASPLNHAPGVFERPKGSVALTVREMNKVALALLPLHTHDYEQRAWKPQGSGVLHERSGRLAFLRPRLGSARIRPLELEHDDGTHAGFVRFLDGVHAPEVSPP
jgi:hypothetical protein